MKFTLRCSAFSWAVKPVTVVMNHMCRIVCDPDFSFPTDSVSPLGEGFEIFEGADKDFAELAFRSQTVVYNVGAD